MRKHRSLNRTTFRDLDGYYTISACGVFRSRKELIGKRQVQAFVRQFRGVVLGGRPIAGWPKACLPECFVELAIGYERSPEAWCDVKIHRGPADALTIELTIENEFGYRRTEAVENLSISDLAPLLERTHQVFLELDPRVNTKGV